MIEALFQTLEAGFSLWESVEKRKYLDRMLELRKAYYEEYSKDISVRSDAVLDNIGRELRDIAFAFASSVGAKNASDKP